MFINNLAFNKQEKMRKAFKEKSTDVEFAKTKFRIYEPNYNGGSISSNCNSYLDGKDLNVISMLTLDELNSIEKDVDYLKLLIANRKAEFLEPQTITEINVIKTKHGNKRICNVYVDKYVNYSDIYGDSLTKDEEILEEYCFSDTKPFQKEISDKIEFLKEKYNIKYVNSNVI